MLFFSITPTYFVILNVVFQMIPGTSSGRAMLLFIYLVIFYFRNAESQCISMERQHTGKDNTLTRIDRSVLAVDVSMDSFCVFFVFSFFKKMYLKRVSLKEIKKLFGVRSPWGAQIFGNIQVREVFDLLWPF